MAIEKEKLLQKYLKAEKAVATKLIPPASGFTEWAL